VKVVNMKKLAQHARRIDMAGTAAQQLLRLLAPVGTEMLLQQIDHRPQMPPFLHVHLEQVAQVIEAGRGGAEMALLFDTRRLGVALDHQQPAQHGAVFARHLLPDLLAPVMAEADGPSLHRRGEQDAPFVLGHTHEPELRPAGGIDADRGAQIDQRILEPFRPHVAPPVDVAGMPGFQRPAHPRVLAQPDIVRDQAVVIDIQSVRHPGRSPLRLNCCR
jgi:hypothetical protein